MPSATAAWATDVHLNFLDKRGRLAFARDLVREGPAAIVLTGDISEADTLAAHLRQIADVARRPVYFVLGNHDFYRGSIDRVRRVARTLSANSTAIRWLPAAGVVPLGERACLIGVDGWGDGRLGNAGTTDVLLNDFFCIEELRHLRRPELIERVRALGNESAALARRLLDEALEHHERILFATHVPPFREACWHEGRVSDDNWLPWFTCAAVGDALREKLAEHPDRTCTVLCGHTHGAGVVDILPNLRVYTGAAEYRRPRVAAEIHLDTSGYRLQSRVDDDQPKW